MQARRGGSTDEEGEAVRVPGTSHGTSRTAWHPLSVRCTTARQKQGIVNLLSSLSSSRLVCHTRHIDTPSTNRYKNHRFPAESISHGVWLYDRFCLSYRGVEALLFARGIIVTYEAIRKWCRKLASYMPISSGISGPSPATSGTWMKSFSPSRVNAIIGSVANCDFRGKSENRVSAFQ